ncbi:NAD(P)/FAD-dependent oxidoreductase [Candidatus Saganbacteria bacterium]|nr:NAD(P)/FAD-dependent oxidoreductase [Candidatus Saganbacteria bacterium]
MDKVQIAIIGGGVIGLAIAAELSRKHQDIVLLEKETSFGQHTSSRNSEVIHAGIYYPHDSLKAKLCVAGNKLLYAFCQANNVPCAKLGKLVVAMNESEIPALEELEKKAKANGVLDVYLCNKGATHNLEPAVAAYAALFSPSTGIIDSHVLMKVLERRAEDNGVMLAYGAKVTAIDKITAGYKITLENKDEFLSEIVINSAGLWSDQVAAMAGIDIEKQKYKLHYCKGEYFSYAKPSFLQRLVYPVPEQDIKGLGIHAVIDLAGRLKFGPSADDVSKIDYRVDAVHREKFFQAIKDLYPQVKPEDLSPDQAGVRPKLQGPGESVRDFVIKEESELGLPGFIDLIGIESPGLTSCLAIGKYVADVVLFYK